MNTRSHFPLYQMEGLNAIPQSTPSTQLGILNVTPLSFPAAATCWF